MRRSTAVIIDVPSARRPAGVLSAGPSGRRRHGAVRAIAYVVAIVAGLGLLPTAFSVADRATVLRLSNEVLDLVSR